MLPNDNARCVGHYQDSPKAYGRTLHNECFGCARKSRARIGPPTTLWVYGIVVYGKCEYRKRNEMTNKELIELAAKAVGFEGFTTEYKNGYVEFGLTNHFKANGSNVWRPLTDDGDALRLAVKLTMDVDTTHPDVVFASNQHSLFTESKNDDPLAATRRAIVRAAAAIGEAK